MTSYVRKNLLTLAGTFFAQHDSGTEEPEPSAAFVSIAFYPPQPAPPVPCPPRWCPPKAVLQKVTIALTLDPDTGIWSCNWDTSVAQGRWWWAVYSVGAVVAAAQGSNYIDANPANLAVQ